MPPDRAQLDHVVLLLPYKDLIEPPSWITENFVLSPGGRHADDKTENRLVLFSEGTYLEIIAFIDDSEEKRRGHWWDKPYGVVDYALTTTSTLDHSALNARLAQTDTDISYTQPREGGRLTPDGQELRWKVTFPSGTERGSVPFWCHDLTPRERRVPISDTNTKHPCGASGMAGVKLEVRENDLSRLTTATAAILDRDSNKDGRYPLDVPREVSGVSKPFVRIGKAAANDELDMRLSLVLYSAHAVQDIHQRYGDGEVSILFERSDQ